MSHCTATFRIDQNAPMLHCARAAWRFRIVRRTPFSGGWTASKSSVDSDATWDFGDFQRSVNRIGKEWGFDNPGKCVKKTLHMWLQMLSSVDIRQCAMAT